MEVGIPPLAFSPDAYRPPDAVSALPGLSLLAVAVGVVAALTEPLALVAGVPIAMVAAGLWGANRLRYVLFPWLVDRWVGHPIRALPPAARADLAPATPRLQPWLRRAPDRVRWSPVLQGERAGWSVSLGEGWTAVDLGHALPRLDVPLDRGRFWRDVLVSDLRVRLPDNLDGDAIIRRVFGDEAGGPLVTDPLFGWRRLERILRADPALGRCRLLDGHLVLPAPQAGLPGFDAHRHVDHATTVATRLLRALHGPWEGTCRRWKLISAGRIEQGARHAAGHPPGFSVRMTDHAPLDGPKQRVNGPDLSSFSTALARANRRRGGLSSSVRAALRWTPQLAWDARTIRIEATLDTLVLPPGTSLTRSDGPTRGVGHPVLDRLADHHGPADHRARLRQAPVAEPLVELLAMSPTTLVTVEDRVRVRLDLPMLADDALDAALDALSRLAMVPMHRDD